MGGVSNSGPADAPPTRDAAANRAIRRDCKRFARRRRAGLRWRLSLGARRSNLQNGRMAYIGVTSRMRSRRADAYRPPKWEPGRAIRAESSLVGAALVSQLRRALRAPRFRDRFSRLETEELLNAGFRRLAT